MSYSWGPDPEPNTRPRPALPRRSPLENLELPDRATTHHWINRAIWWAITVIAAAFTVLSVLAGNQQGAISWGVLFGLGFIAQSHIRLQLRLDRLENPRRIDLGARPQTPDRLMSRQPRDTRLERPLPTSEATAMTPDARCRMPR